MLLNAQKMRDKLLISVLFGFNSNPDWYKTQEMCDRFVSEDPFMLMYCSNKFKIQKTWDEAIDDCLSASIKIDSWMICCN